MCAQVSMDCLQQVQQYISTQPPSRSLQHIAQLVDSGLQAAAREQRKLSLLLQEARAVQLRERVPEEVAEARRQAVAGWAPH
jgi:hypothetical protein